MDDPANEVQLAADYAAGALEYYAEVLTETDLHTLGTGVLDIAFGMLRALFTDVEPDVDGCLSMPDIYKAINEVEKMIEDKL